jgi:hypothetical protein
VRGFLGCENVPRTECGAVLMPGMQATRQCILFGEQLLGEGEATVTAADEGLRRRGSEGEITFPLRSTMAATVFCIVMDGINLE